MKVYDWTTDDIAEISKYLLAGGVAVLPTDTIYGLVGMATNENVFWKVYEVRKRSPKKKCIVLISDVEDLKSFEVDVSERRRRFLSAVWPGPVSVELPCTSKKMSYLRQGTDSLSFRLPREDTLINLLKLTGPLIAPSANPEGLEPAKNIEAAKNYFGDQELIYVDGGERNSPPSLLISLLGDTPEVIRGTLPPNFPKY